ncbi:MAG: hypothetical protein ACM31C_15925 [Acidobacteriota bacterium]
MDLRRAISILSVSVVVTGSVVVGAAPKKGAGPTATPAAAKGPGAGSGSGSGSAAPGPVDATGAGGGSAVQMTEDTPPADMNGTDENPDAPRNTMETAHVEAAAPAKKPPGYYPIEEALRPITLPQNMSEVSISPHAQVGDGSSLPYAGSDALRARYGITDKIQLGLTYVYGGIYPDPTVTPYSYAAHSGKAIGPDVTVMLQDWIGVRAGLPMYLSPFAMSLALGAPIKFHFGDKWAIGGLDDLLNIKLTKFAPDFYQEFNNAVAANNDKTNTEQQNGHVRVSAYGVYQARPNLAWIGRFGVDTALGTGSSNTSGNTMSTNGGTATFIRAGLQWSPRGRLDVGGSLGFDNLAHFGSFAPQAFLAVRI